MAAEGAGVSRRAALRLGGFAAISLASQRAEAKRIGSEKLGSSENPDETPEERKERKRKEREEYRARQKELDEKAKQLNEGKEQVETEMGSNLRGDYYYPTARKRYLPRVKLAYETIEEIQKANPNLDDLKAAIKGPLDAGSALKLYVSALSGGGLSINSKFMGNMKTYAEGYDNGFKAFEQAVKKKDTKEALAQLDVMKTNILSYREAGKPVGLTGADWGVGEIPDCRNEEGGGVGKMSKCAVGSSFGNANPNLYNRNVKASKEKAAVAPAPQ